MSTVGPIDDLYATAFDDGGPTLNDECSRNNTVVSVETVDPTSDKMMVSPASLAEDSVRKFTLAIENHFRDGSLTSKYRARADVLGTPIPSPGMSKAASPASQLPPILGGVIENVDVKERFSFPWARLGKLLWTDEVGDDVGENLLADDFVDFDAVVSAVQQASSTLLKATPHHLNTLASQINRTYLRRVEMLTDVLVAPCLADVVVDRIIPRIRFAMHDSCINEEPPVAASQKVSEVLKQRHAQMMLGALHELCMTWLHGFVPWLTHVCKSHREEKLLCTSSQSFSRQFKRDVAASIRHVARKRDLHSEAKSGAYPRGVLIPLSWVDALELWLDAADEASTPPPLRTWKLEAQDFATAELELNPRKESNDVTKDSVVAVIPEPLFTFLWERFGGGPKLLVTQQCCPVLDRLRTLPLKTALVSMSLSPYAAQQLEKTVEGYHENQRNTERTSASPVVLIGHMPEHTLICDVMAAATHVVDQLFPGATPQQSNALMRCLLYGHCTIAMEGVRDSESGIGTPEVRQQDSLSTLIGLANGINGSRQEHESIRITVAALRMLDKPFGQCGLDNLGNTCFMNSGLQCLSNLPKFRRAMLDGQFTKHAPPDRIPLTLLFTNLIRDLWRGETDSSSSMYPRNSICPSGFKKEIGSQCGRFSGYEQQDAIEFIEVLLDRLHDELNPVVGKRFRERHDDDAKIDVHRLSDIYWKDYFNNNDTLITRLFYRQERTRFECLSCGHKTTVFDAQSSLPVPVGEEQYVSVDVTFFFNRHDAALADPSATNGTVAHHCRQVENVSGSHDPNRLAVRVRVPVDSAHSVVLSEVRHVLVEGRFVSKSEVKTVLMFYRPTVPGNWLSCHAQTSRQVVRRYDTVQFMAVLTPSYQAVMDRIDAVKKGGPDSLTPASAPLPSQTVSFGVAGGMGRSQSADTNGLDRYVRIMFFLNDSKDVDKWSSPALVSYVQRAETTNRDLWRMAEHVFKEGTEEIVVPPATDERPDDAATASPAHPAEDIPDKAQDPVGAATGAGNEEQTTEADASLVHDCASSTAVTTPQPQRRFSLLVSRTCSEALDTVPLDDEPFPFPMFTTYEAITLRFSIVVNEAHVSTTEIGSNVVVRCRRLSPMEHESRHTVTSNEAAEERAAHDSRLTLEKALANMCETHVLKGDDAWYCPNCKEHRESVTESAQFILPTILTIHLKRFKASMYGTMNKIETPLVFPQVLDMKPFMASDEDGSDDSQEEDNENHRQQEKTTTDKRCSPRTDAVYDLCGVVYHSGSLSFGHYTAQAFCEGAAEWVYYNDSSAYPAKAPPHPEGAYILFYQRRDQQLEEGNDAPRNSPSPPCGDFARPTDQASTDAAADEKEAIGIRGVTSASEQPGAPDEVATAPAADECLEEHTAAVTTTTYSGIDSPD